MRRRWYSVAHICDAPAGIPAAIDARRLVAREQRLLPGEGAIDVSGIVGRLPEDTVLAVEAPNPSRVRALGAEEYARRCLAATRLTRL